MKAIAVAAIFLYLFTMSSAEVTVTTNCEIEPSTAEANCFQAFLDAVNAKSDTENKIRAACRDCQTTLIDYIKSAKCPDPAGSAEQVKKSKSRLILHGTVKLTAQCYILQLTL